MEVRTVGIDLKTTIYQRGLLTLSADPFTWGHYDILLKAAAGCQELIVAVLENPDKPQTVFSLEDRVEHVQRILHDFYIEKPPEKLSTVKVISVKGMVLPTDLYLEHECDVLFRGIRDQADQEYENTQASIHRMICPGVNIEMIWGDSKFKDVQSTTVRSLVANYVPVAPDFVPMYIQARMIRKVCKQKRLGVCGYHPAPIVAAVSKQLQERGFLVHEIDLAELYGEVPYGVPCANPGFGLHPRFRAHMSRLLREKLSGLPGVILIRSPELIVNEWLSWVCNNVVVDLTENPENFQTAQEVAKKDGFGSVIPLRQGDDLEELGKTVVGLVQERGAI